MALLRPWSKSTNVSAGQSALLQFLAADDLAGVLEQHREHLEGLFLKPDAQTVLAQLAGAKIQLEDPETRAARRARSSAAMEKWILESKRTTRSRRGRARPGRPTGNSFVA